MAQLQAPQRDIDPGEEPPGWILWCHETHWTLHVTDSIAGESNSLEARGEARDAFSWFSPELSPEEAWKTLTSEVFRDLVRPDRFVVRSVEPRSRQASLAYVAKTDDGQLRMEFDNHGIPIRVRVPGEAGWFFDAELSFSGRQLWSDDDVMNWPACSQPGQSGFLNEPQPCWNSSGSARPDHCFETLAKLTGLDNTLGCSL